MLARISTAESAAASGAGCRTRTRSLPPWRTTVVTGRLCNTGGTKVDHTALGPCDSEEGRERRVPVRLGRPEREPLTRQHTAAHNS